MTARLPFFRSQLGVFLLAFLIATPISATSCAWGSSVADAANKANRPSAMFGGYAVMGAGFLIFAVCVGLPILSWTQSDYKCGRCRKPIGRRHMPIDPKQPTICPSCGAEMRGSTLTVKSRFGP